MKWIILTVTCLLASTTLEAQDQQVWQGQWRNFKYGTSGPLQCVATPGDEGTWKATFSGKFKGDPFEYKVEFQSKPGRGETLIGGQNTVSGHIYDWNGSVKGAFMKIQYKASSGYYGNFTLKQARQ